MSKLKKIFGTLAGLIMLPLGTLIATTLFALAIIIFCILGPLIAPIILIIVHDEETLVIKFLKACLLSFLTTLIAPVSIAITVVLYSVVILPLFFRALYYGIERGYQYPFEFLTLFNKDIDLIFDRILVSDPEEQIQVTQNNVGDFSNNNIGVEQLVYRVIELEDLLIKSREELEPLNADLFREKPVEEPLLSASEIDALKTSGKHQELLESYMALEKKLNEFSANFPANFSANIDTLDEILSLPIKKPALFFRKICSKQGVWRVIRGSTFILCENAMMKHFQTSRSNPLDRTDVNKPVPYNAPGKAVNGWMTEFKLLKFTTPAECHELAELAKELREQLAVKEALVSTVSIFQQDEKDKDKNENNDKNLSFANETQII